MSEQSPLRIIEGNDINASMKSSLVNSARSSVVNSTNISKDGESSGDEHVFNNDKFSDIPTFKMSHEDLLASR